MYSLTQQLQVHNKNTFCKHMATGQFQKNYDSNMTKMLAEVSYSSF